MELKKPLVAVIAAVCLIGAGVARWQWPGQETLQGSLLRLGIVFGALWLALPKPGTSPRIERGAGVLLAAFFLLVFLRRSLLAVLPFLALLGVLIWVFGPRRPR